MGVKYMGQETCTADVLKTGLAACHGLIANARSGSHWVLLTGWKSGSTFYVNGPGFSQTTYDLSEMEKIAVYH
jgi:hypothetical protein